MKAVGKFLALAWTDRLLLMEAWLYLGAARLALLAVPFKRIASHLGTQITPPVRVPLDTRAAPITKRVAAAVDIMSRHTPWESACLAQSIAAKWMLRRRNLSSCLYLGTRKNAAGDLTAHAWLESGNEILIGGAGHQSFVVLSAFVDAAEGDAP